MKSFLSLILAGILTVSPAAAADNPFKVSPELDKALSDGLHELYNLNFDKALAIFETVKDQAEEHPMVAFGIASVHWWRISVYVLEYDPKEAEEFRVAVEECFRVSKKKIAEGDETGKAYLTLGGAEGLTGRLDAANREWMKAYFGGKSAIRNLRRALKTNPKMVDAYMGLGIFDYYVAALPAFVRVLAFLGTGGDKQKGLDELAQAGNEGTYARTPSQLFLVNIYSNLEDRPIEALETLKKLRAEFPVSPFIHMLQVIARYNHGTDEELALEAHDFMARVNDKTYREEFRLQGTFALGLIPFRDKNWAEAEAKFREALDATRI
jgi:tetratricopeptide (TPR) repeat protein